MNKIKSNLLIIFTCLFATTAIAQPGLSVFTINTDDAAGYLKWLTESTPTFVDAWGDSVVSSGICSPISGGEDDGDHYVWNISPSMTATLEANDRAFNDKDSLKAINKISNKRDIKRRDIYNVVKPSNNSYSAGVTLAQYNLLSRPNDMSKYIKTIEAMENAASENGFDDIEFVVFEGFGAGDWARMAMASIQAPSIERLGAFMDARQSDWMAESMSAFPSMRTPVRDWFLLCTTLSSVE